MDKPKFIDLKALSISLGLSAHSLRWHIRRGRIKPHRLGRRLLFDHEQVLRDLKKIQS